MSTSVNKKLDALKYVIELVEDWLTRITKEHAHTTLDKGMRRELEQHIEWCQIGLFMLYKLVPDSSLMEMLKEEDSK
tara:strand:- start:1219 stop:1449 length:231 start_codon:yes stop_codon:yes gene_type:complete